MKYLYKFNESNNKHNEIKDIFVEIFHETDFKVNYETSLGTLNIVVEMPVFANQFWFLDGETSGNPYIGKTETTIENLLNTNDKLKELYLDIDMSIKRMVEYFTKAKYKIFNNKIGTIHIKVVP
jgi:hypothetical protein